jgi:hypothetical protein
MPNTIWNRRNIKIISNLTFCVVCVFTLYTDEWCVHNRLFNANFEEKFKVIQDDQNEIKKSDVRWCSSLSGGTTNKKKIKFNYFHFSPYLLNYTTSNIISGD